MAAGRPVTLAGRDRPVAAAPVGGPNRETRVGALRRNLTPARGLFVRSHFPTPELDTQGWRLSVAGRVRRPSAWTLAQLRALPQTTVVAVLECAGNSRARLPRPAPGELRWGDRAVGSARWRGVALSELLERAGPEEGGTELVFVGADRGAPRGRRRSFARSLSTALGGEAPGALVALSMNGRPLTGEHGWPARLVVPGWYGMAWVKWLSRIEVRATPFRGHFQTSRYVYRSHRGRSTLTEPVRELRVKSLVVDPAPGARLRLGVSARLSGKAWSGRGPVTLIEVDTGSGWQTARLSEGAGPYDWVGWSYRWTPTEAGPAVVRVRATDADGRRQPEDDVPNDFQYGTNSIHRVGVRVG